MNNKDIVRFTSELNSIKGEDLYFWITNFFLIPSDTIVDLSTKDDPFYVRFLSKRYDFQSPKETIQHHRSAAKMFVNNRIALFIVFVFDIDLIINHQCDGSRG